MLGGTVMLLALAAASTLPLPDEGPPTPSAEEVLYDQRQNGTENFRLQMSDVTVVVAPAEALLSVPSDIFDQAQVKPKSADKATRSKQKLAHFLMNVLNRHQH